MDLLGELQRAEFKEAFDEFDKVSVTLIFHCYFLRLLKSMYKIRLKTRGY